MADDPQSNEYRVSEGEKPPETIRHEGRRYKPVYLEVTQEADRRSGEQVWVIAAMGEPLEDEDGDDGEAVKK